MLSSAIAVLHKQLSISPFQFIVVYICVQPFFNLSYKIAYRNQVISTSLITTLPSFSILLPLKCLKYSSVSSSCIMVSNMSVYLHTTAISIRQRHAIFATTKYCQKLKYFGLCNYYHNSCPSLLTLMLFD